MRGGAGRQEQQEQHVQRSGVGSGHISGARGRRAVSVLRMGRLYKERLPLGTAGNDF